MDEDWDWDREEIADLDGQTALGAPFCPEGDYRSAPGMGNTNALPPGSVLPNGL